MKYRNLGHSGLKVSVIGLGTNQFGGKVDQEGTNDIIDAAIDAGVNLIDTADIYQQGRSETAIGKAIKGKRDKVLIATKFRYKVGEGPNDQGASRAHIFKAVEDSLRRLATDFIDLYQIHGWDEETPIEETMQALDDLVRMGKVRYIGASNFSAWQLTQANATAKSMKWHPFVSIQPHYHMFEREIEKELIPACTYFNIGILPYFPLAGGFLTGKYRVGEAAPSGSRGESSKYVQGYMTSENFTMIEKLQKFAEEYGRTLTELAHAWLITQPKVSSVISGATSVAHVKANSSSADWEFSEGDYAKVNKILEGEGE